jgi:hypothetical protein
MADTTGVVDATIVDTDVQKHYEDELPKLMALSDKDIVGMTMPPDEASVEISRMSVIVNRDSKELLAVGTDPEFVSTFGARAGALIYAIAMVNAIVNESENAQEQWRTKKPVAVKVREELILGLAWALRGIQKAIDALNKIKEGSGNSDLIGDLLALYILASQYKDLLKKYGIKDELVEQAKMLNAELNYILAHCKVDPDEYKLRVELVNRAWTHIKKPLEEIYQAGNFAFFNDPEKAQQYSNEYYKELGKLGAKAAAEKKKAEAERQTQLSIS